MIKSFSVEKWGRIKAFEGIGCRKENEVHCGDLYPNHFIVKNKKEENTWVYPMKISWKNRRFFE